MTDQKLARYGVHEQGSASGHLGQAADEIRLVGYSVVPSGCSKEDLAGLSTAFDAAHQRMLERHGGKEKLARIAEDNAIRALLSYESRFLALASNSAALAVARDLLGGYITLNQQNGVINPPAGEYYNQAAWHRDLPYQHFVSTRPIAVSALFCLDDFTAENGATWVVPASHKIEHFPSDEAVEKLRVQVEAPAGSFIMFDSMLFHSGGANRTARTRRGVNHVYSIPLLRQQIDLPALLGPGYSTDPAICRFLGYDVQTPQGISDFYETRYARLGPPNTAGR